MTRKIKVFEVFETRKKAIDDFVEKVENLCTMLTGAGGRLKKAYETYEKDMKNQVSELCKEFNNLLICQCEKPCILHCVDIDDIPSTKGRPADPQGSSDDKSTHAVAAPHSAIHTQIFGTPTSLSSDSESDKD